ncbi:hypothetical protein INT47_005749 [Mucor saturninus]|uniref:RlpA-like protein double-psi beta-barrel domain-containing protein n=1 Tax=Mucor saturninus TaxID=64648 RepID=A0A8H7UVP4_9FUNG|nr:hypothetical protein INT47_005749 [Mucor saturninus]
MKLLACISLCALVIASLINVAKAFEIQGRGMATLMNFDNSTISEDSLEKRKQRGTWYSGNDLKNAACYDRNGLPAYSASINSMIGAMAMKKFENCYKCMKITNKKNKKTVTVKIVDKCAGCIVNKAIDLTPAAFKKLANLDEGVIDITWKAVTCPKSQKPSYGPKKK